MVTLWRDVAAHERLPPVRVLDTVQYPTSDIDRGDLVLLDWTQGFFRRDLDNLLGTGASVIAHFRPATTISARVVIDNVPLELLDCCSADAWNVWEQTLFRKRMTRILGGRRPYDPFELKSPSHKIVTSPRFAFLSTPLDHDVEVPFVDGATAALENLGIEVLNPAGRSGTGAIDDKVIADLEKSHVVVANLRKTADEGYRGYNANVWFEIGFAWSLDKPVLMCRYAGDRFKRPSNLQSFEFISYSGNVDLALQLFYGFGGHATPTPITP